MGNSERDRLEAAIAEGEALLGRLEGSPADDGVRPSTAMALYEANGRRLMASVYGSASEQARTFSNYGHTPDDPTIGYVHGLKSMIDDLHVAIGELGARDSSEDPSLPVEYSVERVRQLLDPYLAAVYDLTNGGLSLEWPHQDDVSRAAGVHPDLGALVAQRLKDDGLVNFETFGPTLSVTLLGRDRVESMRSGSEATPALKPSVWRRAWRWVGNTLAGRSGFIRAVAFWVLLAAASCTILWTIWTISR